MAKTYLQLVNEVLKRVRESQVGQVNANPYSVLVSTYVNDAKRVVEDSWNWSVLNHTVNFQLAPGTLEYDLGDPAIVGGGNQLNERSLLQYDPCSRRAMAFDVSAHNETPIYEISYHRVISEIALDTSPSAYKVPMFFSVRPSAESILINLYEEPAEVRDWRMLFKRPQNDLEQDSDPIKVPWLPVVLLATNYALNEKGEEVGQPGNEAEKKYFSALSDAIALDERYSRGLVDFNAD